MISLQLICKEIVGLLMTPIHTAVAVSKGTVSSHVSSTLAFRLQLDHGIRIRIWSQTLDSG